MEREVSLLRALPAAAGEWPVSETPEFVELRLRVAESLRQQAEDIATRWEAQSRAAMSAASPHALSEERRNRAAALVRSLAEALAASGAASDDAVVVGLAFGAAAGAAGLMLHHLLRALDLLVAMCLYAMEEAVAHGQQTGDLADGIRLCRRAQRAAALFVLAATRGYTQAANDATREQFRRLRHDMRNPLATIQNALSLMDDESIPEETRRSPRFHSMIQRNVRTLDQMIVARLSDAEARSSIGAYQCIAPRAVVCAVRRDLRSESEARGVSIVVSCENARYRLDAAGVELLLHDVLLAVLNESPGPELLAIDCACVTDAARASIQITSTPPRALLSAGGALERLAALASGLGMWFEVVDGHIILSFPIALAEPSEESGRDTGASSARLDDRKPRDDLGGARERNHGQSRVL